MADRLFLLGWLGLLAGIVLVSTALGLVAGAAAVLGFVGGMAILGAIGLLVSVNQVTEVEPEVEQ